MSGAACNGTNIIQPDMTVLDVVSRYRQTEAVFKRYDDRAGVCICCHALFEPLRVVSDRYRIDLEDLLTELEEAAASQA